MNEDVKIEIVSEAEAWITAGDLAHHRPRYLEVLRAVGARFRRPYGPGVAFVEPGCVAEVWHAMSLAGLSVGVVDRRGPSPKTVPFDALGSRSGCPVAGCKRQARSDAPLCGPHWDSVPEKLRRPVQFAEPSSEEWFRATKDAVDSLPREKKPRRPKIGVQLQLWSAPAEVVADEVHDFPTPAWRSIESEGLAELAVRVLAAGRVGLDLETTSGDKDGLDGILDRPRLLQIGMPAGDVAIVDLFRVGSLGPVADALRGVLVVGHNLLFDLTFLAHHLDLLPVSVFDTFTASRLLDKGQARPKGSRHHALETVVERHLGVRLPKDLQRSDWAGQLTRSQLDYAARDAAVLLPLREVLSEQLRATQLDAVAQLENEVLPVMVDMRLAGVAIDRSAWADLVEKREEEAHRLRSDLTSELGVDSLNSQPQVLAALQARGLPVTSTSKEALAAHREDPAVARLLRSRELQSFVTGLGRTLYQATTTYPDGQVRANWDPLAAPTGRVSCSAPNLMALPKRAGPEVRRCVVPARGRVFIVADYAAIELRVLADHLREPAMTEAFRRGEDLHYLTAAAVLGKPVVEVTKDERQKAKAVNFGFQYGMGPSCFVEYARTNYGVEVSLAEAETARERFFQTYPGIRAWHRRVSQEMPDEVRTASGRARVIPADRSGKFNELLNTPIQGTAADGLKRAMVLLAGRLGGLGRIVLCVHDELVVEAPWEHAQEVLSLVSSAMREGMEEYVTTVPIVVEADIRRTWADRVEEVFRG